MIKQPQIRIQTSNIERLIFYEFHLVKVCFCCGLDDKASGDRHSNVVALPRT
jgi:hypothetical protein